jgi:hypothetical protein
MEHQKIRSGASNNRSSHRKSEVRLGASVNMNSCRKPGKKNGKKLPIGESEAVNRRTNNSMTNQGSLLVTLQLTNF